jgi:cytochrome P450
VAQKLPYLDAVIDESMRCHWTTRFPQLRDVPKGGIIICGNWVPPGVTVSTYGSVLHHRKEVFGDDVDVFRPERWLGEKERVQVMRNTMFSFGSGKYSCLGRHLSKLEILKFVPSVLREFDVSAMFFHS